MKKHVWEESIKSVLESVFLWFPLKAIIDFNITFSFRGTPSKVLLLNCGSAEGKTFFLWGRAHITLLHLKFRKCTTHSF